MSDFLSHLETTNHLGNSLLAWASALAVLVVVFFGLLLARKIIAVQSKKSADRSNLRWLSHFLTAVASTKTLTLLIIAVEAGALVLTLPAHLEALLAKAVTLVVFLQAGFWVNGLYDVWYQAYYDRQREANPSSVTALGLMRVAVRVGIWVCVVLLALTNVGINVSALLAGLGIGGIAIALAVQNMLGDLLASLSIILDKPFVVGDFLIVDDHMGSVEHIGIKTTRLRSLSGEQLVFSNTNLLQSRIRNYGRMYQRRVAMTLGVTYSTPIEQLEAIPAMIREAIETQDNTRFDRAHFKVHGPYSLDFEYVYYVMSSDYNTFMDIQQAINLTLHRAFAAKKIDFAFPTQTIYVERQAVAEFR